jgi:kynurenine formamidase
MGRRRSRPWMVRPVAAPLKIVHGSGSPLRVLALVE